MVRQFFRVLGLVVFATCFCLGGEASQAAAGGDGKDKNYEQITVHQLDPDPRGGRAYRLVYFIRVPLPVFWRFKTDFGSDFLLTNEYILEHRLVSQNGPVVITETKYSIGPDTAFRWRTTVSHEAHRFEFVLLNPEECGQEFHRGYMQAEAVDDVTRVTQVAYFDFWGVSLWVYNPWRTGMTDFLTSMARWEQETVLRLKDRYSGEASHRQGNRR